jgi:hypothetical protein
MAQKALRLMESRLKSIPQSEKRWKICNSTKAATMLGSTTSLKFP